MRTCPFTGSETGEPKQQDWDLAISQQHYFIFAHEQICERSMKSPATGKCCTQIKEDTLFHVRGGHLKSFSPLFGDFVQCALGWDWNRKQVIPFNVIPRVRRTLYFLVPLGLGSIFLLGGDLPYEARRPTLQRKETSALPGQSQGATLKAESQQSASCARMRT